MCCLFFLYFGPLSILLWPSLVCLTLVDRYQIWYSPVTCTYDSVKCLWLFFSVTYMVKYLIMLMVCHHPVNPGVNRDVKMWFTYKLITWSHKVATLLFWPPSVVWLVVWQSSFHMVLFQWRKKFLWKCAPAWSAADVFGHCIRTPR